MLKADLYDPLSEQSHVNPYPVYAHLRDEAPVYFSNSREVWALSRYDDVQAALRDWATFSSASGVDVADYVGFFGAGNFIAMDSPAHDILRKIFAPRFASREIKSLEPMVRESAIEIIDGLAGCEKVDLGSMFTQRLPVITICRLLGIPEEDIGWAMSAVLEMMARPPGEVGPSSRAKELRDSLVLYFTEQVRRRRSERSTGDILAEMAAAIDTGLIEESDIFGLSLLLITAGMETTASVLGNIVYAVANAEVRLIDIFDQQQNLPVAVLDEFLRHDAPVQWLCRVTTREVKLHGKAIPAGARVLLLYGSANRDPRRFEEPNMLNFNRRSNRSLTFGDGIHFCLGMPLAKLEARVGIEELFRRFPTMRLTGTPERYPSHLIRGFARIPVALS